MLNNKDVTVVLLCIEVDSPLVKKQFTPPFGLLVAASVLRDKSINVIIKHLIFKDDIEQLLIQTCGNAFAVGFTTMTSANLLATIKATRLVKSLGFVTFWGGTHATLLPELSLLEQSVDFVLRGEAESNLFEFIQWKMGIVNPSKVPGLCYKDTYGRIVISEIPELVPEFKLANHSFDLLELSPYLEKRDEMECSSNYIHYKMLPYMTSKGCNKRCSFCYNGAINRFKWRGYNINSVFVEMDWLIENHGVEGWLFYDDNMFVDKERAWKIIDRYKMPSFVEVDLNNIDVEFLNKADRLNVNRIYIGIESGSDIVLRKINKGINRKSIMEKMRLLGHYSINVELSFMILFPGETPDELSQTLDLIEELSMLDNISINGPKIYNPYPGTELYNELVASGWIPPASNEEWSKLDRKISPFDTGYNLSDKHIKILNSKGLL